MRPNRSVEIPPTKPVGTPSLANPTATLRQDPPTTGLTASFPSAAATGTKSISASPQLSIIVFDLSASAGASLKSAHRLAALAIKSAQQAVYFALLVMKFSHSRCGRFGQATECR